VAITNPTSSADQSPNDKVQTAADFLSAAWDVPDDLDGQSEAYRDWAAKRKLAASIHELARLCTATDATADTLDAVREMADAAVEKLEKAGARSFEAAWKDGSYVRDPVRWTDRVWLVGGSNPSVPRLKLAMEDEVAVGAITFDETCVGAPGWAHGGMVAAAFDQTCGFALISKGLPIVTAKLTVDYVLPTPLNVAIRYSARETKRGDRTVHVDAKAHRIDGGGNQTLIGKAKALFVIVKPEVFEKNAPGRGSFVDDINQSP